VTWDGLTLLTGISIPVSPLEPCQERAQRHQIFCVARVSDSRVQAQQLRQLRVEPWFNPFLIVPDRSSLPAAEPLSPLLSGLIP
jgi:hypothetical protein